jgi:periplasmic copper chaperone A
MTLGFICAVLASCLLSQPLCAGSGPGNLAITKAWSRATPGGAKVAGGYLTIENRGSVPDRLLSGSTGLARSIEVHEMVVSNGLMMMRPIDVGLTIEPGETVKFAPGGRHLMFLGLKGPLKRGEHIPVTLMFEHAARSRSHSRCKAWARRRLFAKSIPRRQNGEKDQLPRILTKAFLPIFTPRRRWPT